VPERSIHNFEAQMRKRESIILACLMALVLLYESRSVVAGPAASVRASALTRDDYVILVLGCVKFPGNPFPCQNDPQVDWRDWLALVRDELGFGERGQGQFDNWSKTHIRFVHAPTADPRLVADAVDSIHSGSGSIFMLGYSAGGTAILEYLETLREQVKGPVPPIRGAVALDSPIGDISDPLTLAIGHSVDFNRMGIANPPIGLADRFAGLGAWCKANGIRVATISYVNDYFNPKHPVADIPFKLIAANSVYGGPFDLERNHGYFFRDPNGLHAAWSYMRNEVFSR
jgi:pimeloyl-ACP methyl ester carboxylesterase